MAELILVPMTREDAEIIAHPKGAYMEEWSRLRDSVRAALEREGGEIDQFDMSICGPDDDDYYLPSISAYRSKEGTWVRYSDLPAIVARLVAQSEKQRDLSITGETQTAWKKCAEVEPPKDRPFLWRWAALIKRGAILSWSEADGYFCDAFGMVVECTVGEWCEVPQ